MLFYRQVPSTIVHKVGRQVLWVSHKSVGLPQKNKSPQMYKSPPAGWWMWDVDGCGCAGVEVLWHSACCLVRPYSATLCQQRAALNTIFKFNHLFSFPAFPSHICQKSGNCRLHATFYIASSHGYSALKIAANIWCMEFGRMHRKMSN